MAKHASTFHSPRSLPPDGHVIAVDIGGTNLRVALADCRGSLLGKWRTSTGHASSPAIVIRQIREGTQELLRQNPLARKSLRAIAVGVPGVTNTNEGLVLVTSYLGGWKNIPLRRELEKALDIPAVIENDVKLAAIGEKWLGAARGLSDFVFLAIGTGIAAGIFVNGTLLHGPDGAAGEVGYMLVPGVSEGLFERGKPGPLEAAIGGEGIRRHWKHLPRRKSRLFPANLTATQIFRLAQFGHPQAATALERAARILAYTISNLSVVLNSSLFILGGGVGVNETLLAATQHFLEGYAQPVLPQLTLSALGEDAQLFGSIQLAVDKAKSLTISAS